MRELFLTSFGNIQYGIWKDEIKSISDINTLHRIPLSPGCIAGITIIDGRTVTLADLPFCMGCGPFQGTGLAIKQGIILIKEEGDNVMGFVVSDQIRTQSISPEWLFPLPDFLKSPVFDICAVHDDIPIPVINTTALHQQVLESDGEAIADSSRIHVSQLHEISAIEDVRVFSVGGERFAMSAMGMEDRAVRPGPVIPLPNTPHYVKGVTFWKGNLLPVIDLSQLIKQQNAVAGGMMLVTEIGGAAFGLLIDGNVVTLPANKVSIMPAPNIVKTSWLKQMVMSGVELFPLIDAAMALSPDTDDDIPVWNRYSPDSGFRELLFKHDVEVVEFSLLGERQALPKVEVEDVIAFRNYRNLPDVPPIVVGVAEHKGEILPVVDLAMMFGRRSLVSSSWRMMLVKNGDFRALVITEKLYGDRWLALEIQREVPIHLPHQFVYGCYPDVDVARLILDVETISVYFERTHIKKFLPALSDEMKQSPTGKLYNFLDENVGEELQISFTLDAKANSPVEPQSTEVAKPTAEFSVNLAAQSHQQQTEEVEVIDLHKPPAMNVEAKAELDKEGMARPLPFSASAQQLQLFSDEPVLREQTYRELAQKELAQKELAQKELAQKELAQKELAQKELAQKELAQKELAQKELAQKELAQKELAQKELALKELALKELAQKELALKELALKELALKELALKELAQNNSEAAFVEAGKVQRSIQTKSGRASASSTVIPFSKRAGVQVHEAPRPLPSVHVKTFDRPSGAYRTYFEEQRIIRERNRRIAYGVIAVVLIAVTIYFSKTYNIPVIEQPEKFPEQQKIKKIQAVIESHPTIRAEPSIAKAELAKAQDSAAQVKEKAKVEHEEKINATKESEAKENQVLDLSRTIKTNNSPLPLAGTFSVPLELNIPKHMPPVDIDVYVVVHGDTLWSISERLTGSPFNYPRIAGRNKIANPNLIFPGQKIQLIK